jgi:hypothetical protein
MGILDRLLKRDRKYWFLCYACLHHTNHETVQSVFYYQGPPVAMMGRRVTPCPRCESTNTISFQQLRDEGSGAQLWGLERLVKQHPRSRFEIKTGGDGHTEKAIR